MRIVWGQGVVLIQNYSLTPDHNYRAIELVPTDGVAFVAWVGFTPPLALTVTRAFVYFGILVGGHIIVRDWAEAFGVQDEVGFGLGMLQIKERVVFVGRGILLRFGISHRKGTSRNVGGRSRMVRPNAE